MSTAEKDAIPLLAVDDRRENLVALSAILDSPEYRLMTATSGKEALRQAFSQQFAVVLLDVVMPDMDGFEVAAQLRSIERTRRMPVIFMTAEADDAARVFQGYAVGAVDYMTKPLQPDMVRAKVAVFADLYRQRQEIEGHANRLREVERRDFELRLAELRVASDRRYHKLVEGIDHAIAWSADPDTLGLTFASRRAEQLLGLPVKVLLEEGFWQKHVHPEDLPSVLDAFRRAIVEGTDQDCNHRMIAGDGRELWFHTGVSADTASEGGPDAQVELHGVSVDVTELKRAEETARSASQAREELLAIVSHDLRNLLNSIVTGAGLLDRVIAAPGAEGSSQRAIETILRAARRMDRLVGDLLDLASIQAGRVAMERRPVDALELTGEALRNVESAATSKLVHVDGGAAPGLLVLCDRERVLQVLLNLLSNALKFTPAGGRVRLHAERRGAEALFTVSDTGPGVTPDQVPLLFDRFWQANSKTGVGVGLGLTIAKRLIEAHGGRVWLSTDAPPGATFHFTLPLASGSASLLATTEPDRASPPPAR